ncbi:hypothetical protein NUACC26_011130 [Scytonema sp. NUACC26]
MVVLFSASAKRGAVFNHTPLFFLVIPNLVSRQSDNDNLKHMIIIILGFTPHRRITQLSKVADALRLT